MKQFLRAIVLALCAASALSAADVAGSWRGTLDAGIAKLRLGVNVKRADSGALTATMDSYDQGAIGIPIDSITQDGNRIHFAMAALNASYKGELTSDGNAIEGTFTQAGRDHPLRLTRGTGGMAMNRPQEPRPPWPYREEEVILDETKAGVKLGGTLTLPSGAGPFPAVVLLSGSGLHDRNETLFGHKPFLVIADYLTRHGAAILRFDDRGVGKSTGNKMASTGDELAGDAVAWVELLRTRKDIAPNHVGLIGHSEGGILAPLAAVRSADVAFIVMLAGPAIPGDQLLKLQARAMMRAAGTPESMIRQENEVQEKLFAILRAGGDPKAVDARLRETLRDFLAALPEAQRRALGDPQQFADAQVKTMMSPDMRSIILSDPEKTLRQVKCPVLALNGALDLQVPADANLPALVAALGRGQSRLHRGEAARPESPVPDRENRPDR